MAECMWMAIKHPASPGYVFRNPAATYRWVDDFMTGRYLPHREREREFYILKYSGGK